MLLLGNFFYPAASIKRDDDGHHIWNDQNVDEVRRQLETGDYFSVGEVNFDHNPWLISSDGDYHAFNSEEGLDLVDLVAEFDVPLTVHIEGKSADMLEEPLEHNPDAVIIWAHGGDEDADVIMDWLDAHENLYIDISARNPTSLHMIAG